MKKWILPSVVIALVAGCATKTEPFFPQRSPITESVYATGVIRAGDQHTVFATVTGTLEEVLVESGDTVQPGDLLFTIRDLSAGLNSEQARLALELSLDQARKDSDRLRELEEQVSNAHRVYELDSSLFKRQQRLWEQQIGSKLDLEKRELAFESSRSNWLAARARYRDIQKQLINAARQAQAGSTRSQRIAGEYQVTAEFPGVIYDMPRTAGELITPQTPLAITGSSSEFILELQVDELDIVKIKAGQLVLVSLDSYGDEVFHARVHKITPLMNERNRTFLVEASFEKQPPVIYPNLTTEANIVVQEKENALLIPSSFLLPGDRVLTSSGDTVQVTIGLRDFEKAEVLSGIDEKTGLLKPGSE